MRATMADGTLMDLLAGAPEAPALVCPDDGTTLTYAALAGVVDDLASGLAGLGVGHGDRVALSLPNGPEFVYLLLALGRLGAAAAPLNPAYTVDEFAFYLDDVRPTLLLLPAGELDPGREAAAAAADGPRVVDLVARPAAAPELRGASADAPATAAPAGGPDDIALLLHTSGTTSRPKQVPLLHRNLLASARSIARHYALGPADVSYCLMPLFHIHGLVASTFAQLAAGGAVVVPRRVAPARFWQHLPEHGVTWTSAGPTLHHMLLDRAGDAAVPASLRFVRSCSSALSPELFRRAEERYGVPVLEAYGMTEASHEMAANPLPPAERRAGSVGVPTGAEIRIVDAAGGDVAEGAPGEVVIRGPGVTPGYLNNPQANADSFFGEWFRTGDQGVLEGGYLRLTGRIKEIIIRGGENISPLEVEDVLLRHPKVREAVAFGVPDPKYGETVAAALTLHEPADEAELLAHCRAHLTAVKVPTTLHLLEAIPRTATGKVQRRRMAQMLGHG